MSHPRNSSSRKRMLYPRLTYGADKRYLRRKSLIKIYRREIRGERVSKGDVNEPALPPPFLLFVERRTRIRKGEGGERGDNRRREDRGRRWSILRQFHRSLSSRVSFFFREIVEKRKVYLFILFLISEKFITSGLLLLFIVIRLKRNTWIVLIFNRQFVKKKSRKRKTYFGLNVLFAQRKWDLDS